MPQFTTIQRELVSAQPLNDKKHQKVISEIAKYITRVSNPKKVNQTKTTNSIPSLFELALDKTIPKVKFLGEEKKIVEQNIDDLVKLFNQCSFPKNKQQLLAQKLTLSQNPELATYIASKRIKNGEYLSEFSLEHGIYFGSKEFRALVTSDSVTDILKMLQNGTDFQHALSEHTKKESENLKFAAKYVHDCPYSEIEKRYLEEVTMCFTKQYLNKQIIDGAYPKNIANKYGIKTEEPAYNELLNTAVKGHLGARAYNGENCITLAKKAGINRNSSAFKQLMMKSVEGQAGERALKGKSCDIIAKEHGICENSEAFKQLMMKAIEGPAGKRVANGESPRSVAKKYGIKIETNHRNLQLGYTYFGVEETAYQQLTKLSPRALKPNN